MYRWGRSWVLGSGRGLRRSREVMPTLWLRILALLCAIIFPFRSGGFVTRARVKSKQHGPGIFFSAVILLLATFVAYWNTFDVPLVFDDLLTIQANWGFQFGDNLRPSIWATRPLLYLSFAINYALHGQRVWGYHFVNFLLHFVNGILVLLIAKPLFRHFALDEP